MVVEHGQRHNKYNHPLNMGVENTKRDIWPNKFTKKVEESELMTYCMLRFENYIF